MIVVGPLSALPRGEGRRIDCDPPVAVFHTDDGQVFAIDDTCTHQDASLADGWLEGCEVECPLHASRFDLRTGRVDAPPAKVPVRTYPVAVIDGVIHVDAPAGGPSPDGPSTADLPPDRPSTADLPPEPAGGPGMALP